MAGRIEAGALAAWRGRDDQAEVTTWAASNATRKRSTLSCVAEPSRQHSSKRLSSSEPPQPQPHLAAHRTKAGTSQTHTKPKQRKRRSGQVVLSETWAASTTTRATLSPWNSGTAAKPETRYRARTRSAS
nr:MAG TPA: hypothetical protein [Caudoviricetes sp.]